ncbi:hypothetical protein Catovirus_1_595 [Catovirus CTV1]|uniref:Uncharacterized protein n=1 Tax=Catovirus CTV1 TaxID=1977631 RepID=A0A1V0SA03_9VIRU|nr:hypothetical protein Catovirus_1_595 [Catovirus CTV1]
MVKSSILLYRIVFYNNHQNEYSRTFCQQFDDIELFLDIVRSEFNKFSIDDLLYVIKCVHNKFYGKKFKTLKLKSYCKSIMIADIQIKAQSQCSFVITHKKRRVLYEFIKMFTFHPSLYSTKYNDIIIIRIVTLFSSSPRLVSVYSVDKDIKKLDTYLGIINKIPTIDYSEKFRRILGA